MKDFFYAISVLIATGCIALLNACEKEPGMPGQQTEQVSLAPVHKEGEIIITIADHTTAWKPELTDCQGDGNGCAAEVTVTYVEECKDCQIDNFKIEIVNPPKDIGGVVADGDDEKVVEILSGHRQLFSGILGVELVDRTINGDVYISSVKIEEEGSRWARFVFEFRNTVTQSFHKATPFVCILVTIPVDPEWPEPIVVE